MTTFNTGNPLGSTDPRDLYDNAQVIDDYANSESATTTDRLGNSRKTLGGMNDEFDSDQTRREGEFDTAQAGRQAQFVQLMISGGYEFLGDYESGIEFTSYKQIVRDGGEFWRPAASTDLPYTTTGAGIPEGGALVNVGDGLLRQDLVQPVATFNNVQDMKDAARLDVGRKVRTLGYQSPGDGGGNDYEIVAAGTGTDDGGSFIDLNNGLQAKGLFVNGFVRGSQYGSGDSTIRDRVEFSNLVYNDSGLPTPQMTGPIYVFHDSAETETTILGNFRRLVNTQSPANNPRALRAFTKVGVDTTATEWALSGEIEIHSETNGGFTATSGVATKYAKGQGFAGHFQVKNEIPGPSSVTGSMIGAEINLVATDDDDHVGGVRFGIDLIAKTNESLLTDGVNPATHRAGIRIRNTSSTGGGIWRSGILLVDGTDAMPTAIEVKTNGTVGILMNGSQSDGIRFTGNYTAAAIALHSGRKIAFEGTGVLTLSHDNADNQLHFQSGSEKKISLRLSGANPYIAILEDKVIGKRMGGWGEPSGTATRSSFDTATVTTEALAERLKALIDDLNSISGGHGLIGP